MTHLEHWRDFKRVMFHLGVLAACCLLAVCIHRAVAADTLGDVTGLVLQIAGLLIFIGAVGFAIRSALGARSVAERVVLRLVPIGLVLAGATFVKSSYADVSVVLHELATPDEPSNSLVVLGPGGRDVRLSGELSEGVAHTLDLLLAGHPKVERIALTSEGGLVDEGAALRVVIATHHLTTFVPDYCVSACTLAFLGGRERLMMSGARLGFHAPYEEGMLGQTFATDKTAERAAYISAGVAPDFVDEALAVDPADLWTPEALRLIAAHVVTGVVGRYALPDSNLDGSATLAGARAAVLRNFPLAAPLAGWRPQALDVIAGWYLDAYRNGVSEGQAVDGLKAIIGDAAAIAMMNADDETLLGLGRFVDTAMRAAATEADCATLGQNPGLVQAEDILDRGDAGADRLAVALLARALKTMRPRPANVVPSQPEPMAIGLKQSGGACAELRSLYARALRLPRHDAATTIRALIGRSGQGSALALSVVGAPG